MPMYGADQFEKLYIKIREADETELLEPTIEALKLLCRSIFVECSNWREPLALVPFTLDDGVTHHALAVNLGISSSSLPNIFGEYDTIEFFILRPADPLNQPAPIAYRTKHGSVIVAKYVPLNLLPEPVLRMMHGHILVNCCSPEYSTDHTEFRSTVEQNEIKRIKAAAAAQNP